MSNIEFEENNNFRLNSKINANNSEIPKMVDILIKTGVTKDTTHAEYILISITIVLFLLTIMYIFHTPSVPKDVPIRSAEEVLKGTPSSQSQ